MDCYKFKTISGMLKITSKKSIEHYVVSRLWHRIDNTNVEMVLQQYVMRQTQSYALVDIAFPQIGILIEVNEPPHYNSQGRIESDRKRIEEVEEKTGYKIYVLDCRKTLVEINEEIEHIAIHIRNEVDRSMACGDFQPWDPDLKRNAEYWERVGALSIDENITLNTIEEICALFNADFSKTKRGFRRVGGIPHPRVKEIFLWWPSIDSKRANWINRISDDEKTIVERYDSDDEEIVSHKSPDNPDKDRVVFIHTKDVFGIVGYKFVGVFRYNDSKSAEQKASVWDRVQGAIDLKL
jgi:hypothetical protein